MSFTRTLIVIGNDPLTNAQVQDKLFTGGFKWNSGDYTIQGTDSLIISANSDGTLYYLNRQWLPVCDDNGGPMQIDRVVDAKTFLSESFNVNSIPNTNRLKVAVKELSMSELNALAVKKFGFMVKIVEKKRG